MSFPFHPAMMGAMMGYPMSPAAMGLMMGGLAPTTPTSSIPLGALPAGTLGMFQSNKYNGSYGSGQIVVDIEGKEEPCIMVEGGRVPLKYVQQPALHAFGYSVPMFTPNGRNVYKAPEVTMFPTTHPASSSASTSASASATPAPVATTSIATTPIASPIGSYYCRVTGHTIVGAGVLPLRAGRVLLVVRGGKFVAPIAPLQASENPADAAKRLLDYSIGSGFIDIPIVGGNYYRFYPTEVSSSKVTDIMFGMMLANVEHKTEGKAVAIQLHDHFPAGLIDPMTAQAIEKKRELDVSATTAPARPHHARHAHSRHARFSHVGLPYDRR